MHAIRERSGLTIKSVFTNWRTLNMFALRHLNFVRAQIEDIGTKALIGHFCSGGCAFRLKVVELKDGVTSSSLSLGLYIQSSSFTFQAGCTFCPSLEISSHLVSQSIHRHLRSFDNMRGAAIVSICTSGDSEDAET
jgi:hypothetical protein